MKCPLILKAYWELGLLQRVEKVDCLKADCAWWDIEAQYCAVLQLERELGSVRYFLKDLRDKLPGKTGMTL